MRGLLASLAMIILSACVQTATPPATVSLKPHAAPTRPSATTAPPSPAIARETQKSVAARTYYGEMQRILLANGRLRTDSGRRDAPFDARQLSETFVMVALYNEYGRKDGGFFRQESSSHLRRWQEPVRLQVIFGESVPENQRQADRVRIGSYLLRLSAITGHPVSMVDSNPNFSLYVVSEDEREALGPTLRAEIPSLTASDIDGITMMPRSTYCLVYTRSQRNQGVLSRAVAVVRAEHPDLIRQACFHEEIAQGLGLPNDWDKARPSIFNDDNEFALLTPMDELLLKILYDPQLRPGMRPEQARPIVEAIANRLMTPMASGV